MSNTAKPVTFIVGMSRGGTTWMSNSLANHPDIAVYGESGYWGKSYVIPKTNGCYTDEQIKEILDRLSNYGILGHGVGNPKSINYNNIRKLLDHAAAQLPENPRPSDLFLQINNAISMFEKKDLVIEKTPHHVNFIDLIVNYFPDARFIIMYRTPYDFMLSYKHAANRDELSSIRSIHAKLLYHPIGCALIWRKYHRSIKYAKTRLPASSYCEVHFKDLKKFPEKSLQKVQEFLQVNIMSGLNSKFKNTSFVSGDRPRLKSDDIFWMNFLCRKEIKEIKIDKKKYTNYMSIVISFIKIPLWAFLALIFLSKTVKGNFISYINKIMS